MNINVMSCARKSAVCFGSLLLSLFPTAAEEFGGIEFPQGAASFADVLVSYTAGTPGPTDPLHIDPEDALGIPNHPGGDDAPGSVSLGVGGVLIVEFTNNVLTGSNDASPDLHIFEVGSDVEDTFVAISRDGMAWEEIGKVSGSTSSIDVDAFGFTSADLFRFVRLTDDPAEGQTSGDTVGADIDAVGAISTAPVDDSPVLEIFPSGSTAYVDTLAAQGAVVHWRLNEASLGTARNSGTAQLAGDGTYGPNVLRNLPSLRAKSNDPAIAFPTKNILSRILAPTFPMPTNALTVTFLVQGKDNGLSSFLGYGVSGSPNEFLLATDGGAFRFALNSGSLIDLAGVDVLDGTPHHVAFSWAASDGQARVYVDGAPVETRTVSTGTPLATGGVLALGQDLDSLTPPNYGFDASQTFVGTLDEFAVFDRVLGPAEITAQYTAATAPPNASPSEVFLEFLSAVGSTYTIEETPHFLSWEEYLAGIAGTGGRLRFPVRITIPNRFFRLE